MRRLVGGLGIVAAWLLLLAAQAPPGGEPQPTLSALKASWPQANEQDWIVSDVVEHVVSMLDFARGAQRSPGGVAMTLRREPGAPRLSYVVTVREGQGSGDASFPLVLGEHGWEVRGYGALAERLLAHWKLAKAPASASPSSDSDTLQTLLRATSPLLRDLGDRLSARLERDMLDAAAQEEAALLTASLGLLEVPGPFSDPRPLMSRTTAHLAVARSLAPEPVSREGHLADVALLTLAGRQAEAVARLLPLEAALRDEAGRAWLRTLRILNTHDWRRSDMARRLSPLEEVAEARAMTASGRTVPLGQGQGASGASPSGTWMHVAAEGLQGVESANAVVPRLIDVDLREFASLLSGKAGADEASVVAALHAVGYGCIERRREGRTTVKVLSPGLWAAFYQRRVLHSVGATELYLRTQLGLEEAATRLRTDAKRRFGTLSLFPLLEQSWRFRGPRGEATLEAEQELAVPCGQSLALLQKSPQVVAFRQWVGIRPCARTHPAVASLGPQEWFDSLILQGTVFDEQRVFGLGGTSSALRTVHDLAPYSFDLALRLMLKEHPGGPTAEQLHSAVGQLPEYDLHILHFEMTLPDLDAARLVALAKRTCALDVDLCTGLLPYLRRRGLVDECVELIEMARKGGADSVSLASVAEELASRYFDRGDVNGAMRIATEAAETGSEAGMDALSVVLERLERFEEARALLDQIVERYPESEWQRTLFFVRYDFRHGQDRFRSEAATAIKTVFPDGRATTSLELLKQDGPPSPERPGFVVESDPYGVYEGYGLGGGDVVMAVDEFRVKTSFQYLAAMRMRDEPPPRFVVWRKGAYVALDAKVNRRHFGPTRYDLPKGRTQLDGSTPSVSLRFSPQIPSFLRK